MVGVPGRSKGCNTCIRRKIKCDQETPSCRNCRKSNRLCTGYQRKRGYVLSEDVSLLKCAELHREDTSVIHHGRWRRASVHRTPVVKCNDADSERLWTDHYLAPGCEVSSHAAFRQQIRYIFLSDAFSNTAFGQHDSKQARPWTWLQLLQGTVILSPALDVSVAAFFAAQVGRKNKDLELIHKSRGLYGLGLKEFQYVLRNPQTRLTDETLAACVALSLYELTECSPGAQAAFRTHQRGAMTLLQLRGPDASASPLGQSLFLNIRAQASTGIGLPANPSNSLFSDPDWIDRPWKLLSKTPHDRLLDMLFEFHTLFQHFYDLSQETNQTLVQLGLHEINKKCHQVESKLRVWYESFEKSASGALYWQKLSAADSRFDNANTGKLFPVSFHFPSVAVAQVVTTYWAGMMAIHRLLTETYEKLTEIELQRTFANPTNEVFMPILANNVSSNFLACHHGNEWKIAARNICHSVEYFLQDDISTAEIVSIQTLLRGCKRNFEGDGGDWNREISWISDFIDQMQQKVGFPTDNLFG